MDKYKSSLNQELEKAMIKRRVMKIANNEFIEHNEAINVVDSTKRTANLRKEFEDATTSCDVVKELKNKTLLHAVLGGSNSIILAQLIQFMMQENVNFCVSLACGVTVSSGIIYSFYLHYILKYNRAKKKLEARNIYNNGLLGAENKKQLKVNVKDFISTEFKNSKKSKDNIL